LDKVAAGSYVNRMRAVGLKTLKNRLSEYVRLVANGETVLVTDRDRVVAELTPPRAGRSELLADATLAEAVRRGMGYAARARRRHRAAAQAHRVFPRPYGGVAARPRRPMINLAVASVEFLRERGQTV
jgi:antitoxin (DNA-binding transcriptional repressor) of toxin-antitoxin stability system